MRFFHEILELQQKIADVRKAHFFQDVLFSWHWWLLVILTLIIWTVWILLVDRRQLKGLLLVGLFSLAFALVLDDIGLSLVLWNYPYSIAFFTTRLNLVDMVILPITFMLIAQFCPKWVPYIIVTVLFSLFASLVAEPIFVKLDLYMMLHWKHIYSTPIYLAMGLIVKGAADLTTWIERKAREGAQ